MTQTDNETEVATAPADRIHAIVRGIAGQAVGDNDSFFDLGLDSIQLMQICNEINDEYGEVIDLFLLFENPTVANCITIVESAGV